MIVTVQQVLDVWRRDGYHIGRFVAKSVGGADQRLAEPRDDEKDPAIGRVKEQQCCRHGSAWYDYVDTFGRPETRFSRLNGHPADRIDPGPGRVQYLSSVDGKLIAVHSI